MKISSIFGKVRNFSYIILGGIALIFVMGCTPSTSDVSVVPILGTSTSVDPSSGYTITLKTPMEIEDMYRNTAFEPKVGFMLETSDKLTYTLKTYEPFKPLEDVILSVNTKEFKFKMDNRISITSVFPRNDGYGVPLNSGIEFTFNTNDITPESMEQAISIEPKIELNFSYSDFNFVAYPIDAGYAPETKYTVTLKNTLVSTSNAKLLEDYIFTFTTTAENEIKKGYNFNMASDIPTNVISTETPIVCVYMNENIVNTDVAVKVYTFKDADSYKNALINSMDFRKDYGSIRKLIDKTDMGTPVSEFTTKPISPAQSDNIYNNGKLFVAFPDTLPQGYYVAELSVNLDGETITRDTLIQVSDLSVYYLNNENNFLVWVNDATTGKPVENASFKSEGTFITSLITDKEGKAYTEDAINTVLASKYNNRSTIFTITEGNRTFIDCRRFMGEGDETMPSYSYMSYIFTDRPIYKSTDTIEVWGTVRPRNDSIPMVKELFLNISPVGTKKTVPVNEDGTFRTTLEIKYVSPEYSWASVNIALEEDGINLTSRSISIQDYVKPLYVATTSVEKPVYLKTNAPLNVDITTEVTTFDGTPTAQFPIKMDNRGGLSFTVPVSNTNDKGIVTSTAKVTTDYDTWYPQNEYYNMSNGDAEAENMNQSGNISVIHRDIMLVGKSTTIDDKLNVEITTNKIDISKVTQENLMKKDILMGAPTSQSITGELRKIYYTSVKTGTYYDYVNRVSCDNFKYVRHDDKVKDFTFSTVNGKYTITDIPKTNTEECYYIVLTTKDTYGRNVTTQVYTGEAFYKNYYYNGIIRFNLDKKTNTDDMEAEYSEGSYLYNIDKNKFTDNENVTFELKESGMPIENMKGRMLYTIAQDGFSHIGTTNTSEINIAYTESLVPNYIILGAYFDGKHIFPMEKKYMYFNPQDRELSIDLATDKSTYNPVDDVNVTVTVKNKSTGAVAADANIVLSIVDEAIFALQEQDVTLLNNLYNPVFFPNLDSYVSYATNEFGMSGEKGGGGGDNGVIRSDFKDTANFITTKTDKNGIGKINFKLPDNITSWRMTALALTKNNYAGDTIQNIIATQEYFVMPIVSKELINGDDCVIGVRSSGIGISSEDKASYTITISGNGVNETKTVENGTRDYASVSFGKLLIGEYSATIKGTCKGFTDTVVLPFSVINSGIHISLIETMDLSKGVKIDSLRYPVEVTVYDKTLIPYNTVFNNVYRNSFGCRADMRLARKYLLDILKSENSNMVEWYDNTDDIRNLQYSLISIFPYSEPDVELTTLAALALPDMVGMHGVSELAGMYSSVLDGERGNYPTNNSYIQLLAHALAKKSVPQDIEELLNSDAVDYVNKMYLAVAQQVLGNTDSAKAYYDKLVKPHLKEIVGLSGVRAYYIPQQGDRSQSDCTTAAMLLATAVGADEKDGLAVYVAEKPNKFNAYIFEQLYYLSQFKPMETKSTFSYVLDSKTITETINRGKKYITLNKSQLEKADFKVLSGEIYADVYYTGTPDQKADESQKVLGITKTITPVGTNKLERGGLVKVVIDIDASKIDGDLSGYTCTIQDYIPTGMRFDRVTYPHNSNWSLNSRQEQRLEFSMYNPQNAVHIVYYLRCAASGEYVNESTYVTSDSSNIWGESGRTMVVIND